MLADATHLLSYKKEDAKTRCFIQDWVKDHIVPDIAEEDTRKKMWDAVCKLYQDSSVNMKLILREKLQCTKQNKGERIVLYLTKLKHVKEELAGVGEKLRTMSL